MHTFAAPDHFQNGSELHFCSSEPRLNSIKPFLISSQPKKIVCPFFTSHLADCQLTLCPSESFLLFLPSVFFATCSLPPALCPLFTEFCFPGAAIPPQRPLFSANKMRASAPFFKRPVNRAKSFLGNHLQDFFQLL